MYHLPQQFKTAILKRAHRPENYPLNLDHLLRPHPQDSLQLYILHLRNLLRHRSHRHHFHRLQCQTIQAVAVAMLAHLILQGPINHVRKTPQLLKIDYKQVIKVLLFMKAQTKDIMKMKVEVKLCDDSEE